MAKKAELRAKLSLDNSAFQRGIKQAQRMATEFGKGVASATGEVARKGLKILEVAALASAAALAYGVKHAYDLGSEMQDMADRTGAAVDQLLILRQAAKDNGIEDISGAIKKMQVNLIDAVKDGASPAAKALNALGLNAEALQSKGTIEQFQTMAKAIGSIKDPAFKTAEAVALFGREGSQLLSLFADSGAIDTATKSLGKQAQILKEYSGRFDAVSDRLNRAGLKFQGFFVGVAERILPMMEFVTKKFDEIDLAEQGERFGDGIKVAVEYFTGAFADPSAFFDASINYLKGGLLMAAGLIAERLAQNAVNFGADIVDAVNLAGVYTAASLEYAFQESIKFFTGGWRDTAMSIGASLIGIFAKAAAFFGDALEKAAKFDFDFKGLAEGARDSIRSYIEDVQFGKTKTFGQMVEENKASSPLPAVSQAMRGSVAGIVGKDIFGAQAYFDAAKEASDRMHKAGADVVASVLEVGEKAVAISRWAAANSRLSNNGGLQGASMALGANSFSELFSAGRSPLRSFDGFNESSALNRGAYAQTPLLGARERRESENTLVAQGLRNRDSRATTAAAYGVVRAGDHLRARNAAIEKERQYQKNQAANVAATAENTAALVEAWGGKGTRAGGS